MTKRDSIIDKIKALLSKTTENGCTEGEMMSALAKAAAMMDAHEITDEEVALTKEEKVLLHPDPDETDAHGVKWRLSHAVGQFCNVQIYRNHHELSLTCIGMPSDAQWAMWLLNAMADFVFAELQEYIIVHLRLAPKSERRIAIRSFVDACCNRISDRLLELTERSRKVRTSNGRELVVIKDAAIKAYMKDHDIHLRTGSCHAPANISEAAHAAGHAAGNRASFGRPVSGSAGVLRIGKS
jgi:hypothetical protein